MPRVKTPEIPFAKVKRLLLGYGLNGPKLAKVLKCSEPTARTRLDDPSKLTLGELAKISRHGVPIDEIRESITI